MPRHVKNEPGYGKVRFQSGKIRAAAKRAVAARKVPASGVGGKVTIHDLGWTRAEAAKVRAQMAAFSVDWDNPVMDIYNES